MRGVGAKARVRQLAIVMDFSRQMRVPLVHTTTHKVISAVCFPHTCFSCTEPDPSRGVHVRCDIQGSFVLDAKY